MNTADADWRWRVQGSDAGYRGTLPPGIDESGIIKAELAGDALLWLVHHGPIWDVLDTDQPFTITLSPRGPDGPDWETLADNATFPGAVPGLLDPDPSPHPVEGPF